MNRTIIIYFTLSAGVDDVYQCRRQIGCRCGGFDAAGVDD